MLSKGRISELQLLQQQLWGRESLQWSHGDCPEEEPQANLPNGRSLACGSTQDTSRQNSLSMMLTWPLRWMIAAPSRFSPPRHQTTAGTDSSPEEILRQAGCKQQQGEGVEHREMGRGSHRTRWLGRWGSCWKGNQQSRHLKAPEKPVNVYFIHTL